MTEKAGSSAKRAPSRAAANKAAAPARNLAKTPPAKMKTRAGAPDRAGVGNEPRRATRRSPVDLALLKIKRRSAELTTNINALLARLG